MTDQMSPPSAAQRPHDSVHHNRTLSDPWAWLRDPGYPDVKDPEILGYLEAENRWFNVHMDANKPLVDALFEEMKGRIKEEDRSVPQKDGAFVYNIAATGAARSARPTTVRPTSSFSMSRRLQRATTISVWAPSPFPMTIACLPSP
jgi:protease II